MTLSHMVPLRVIHVHFAPCFDKEGCAYSRWPLIGVRHLGWRNLVSCHYSVCTFTFLYMCVYVCVCVVLQGATAVSLRGQPTLLWNVHPYGHYYEQHRSGSRGPRASQRTAQQCESHWHLELINKHLEGHNKHTGCQTHSQTKQYLHENVQTNTSHLGWLSDSFGLIKSFQTGLESLLILRNNCWKPK